MGEAFLAIGGKIGNMPNLAKGLRKIVGSIAVVFDDQKPHDRPALAIGLLLLRGTLLLKGRNHDTNRYAIRFNRRSRFHENRREGRRDRPRRPSTTPVPAGATGAGRRYRWGRAACAPVPLVRSTGGGDGCR